MAAHDATLARNFTSERWRHLVAAPAAWARGCVLAWKRLLRGAMSGARKGASALGLSSPRAGGARCVKATRPPRIVLR